MSDPSLVRFRVALEGALAHLESRREEINDLNVFPVADGDTGDDVGADPAEQCLEEVDRLATQVDRPLDEIRREEIVESVARAALLGARGNSGVILSQLHPRRGRGAGLAPGGAHRPRPPGRRDGTGGAARLRLGPRAGRGHDADRHARHGGARRVRAWPTRTHRAWGRTPRATSSSALLADILEEAIVAGRGVGSAASPSCCRSCARRGWSTPAATASSSSSAGVVAHRAARPRGRARAGPPRRRRAISHPGARLLDLPLLHELRRHRRRARRRALRGTARWRSSVTPSWSSAIAAP